MVLESNTGRCASEDVKPEMGVDTWWCVNEDAGPERGWILRSHIGWRGEWSILYKGGKPLHSRRVLKTLRGSLKMKAQRGQYLLAGSLGHCKWVSESNIERCVSKDAELRRGMDTR